MYVYSICTLLNESKCNLCNLFKVNSEPLRTCLEGDNDIAISQMLPDQQPDALSVSAARQVASCALGMRWLVARVSRILKNTHGVMHFHIQSACHPGMCT